MSDTATVPVPPQQRRRPLDDAAAAAAADAPHTAVVATNKHPEVVLNMQDDRYREIMWKHFNILGLLRDLQREEDIALELFTKWSREGARFYGVGPGGERYLLRGGEALIKIKLDIQTRTDTAQSWLRKPSTHKGNMSEPPSTVSDNSEYSGDKISADEDAPAVVRPPSSNENPPPSSVECVDSEQVNNSSADLVACKKEEPDHFKEEDKNRYDDAKIPHIASTLGGTSQTGPNENDTILSLSDPKYRNFMFKSFQQLEEDPSMEKFIGDGIIKNFKMGGGRFFTVDRDGNVDSEVDESMALQKILRDIGARNEIQKRWNLDSGINSQEKEDLPSYRVGNAIEDEQMASKTMSLFQQEMTRNLAMDPQLSVREQISSASSQLSQPIRAPNEELAKSPVNYCEPDIPKHASVATATHLTCQECRVGLQAEEKKQDDHDYVVGSSSTVKPRDDHYFIPSSPRADKPSDCFVGRSEEEKQHDQAVRSSGEARPINKNGEESLINREPKTVEAYSKSEEQQSFGVLLSLNNDYYKEILWKHYRLLGTVRDSDKETEHSRQIFSFLKQKLGERGNFFRRMYNEDVVVDDESAYARILDDIQRRMKNHNKWSPDKKPKRSTRQPSANATPTEMPPAPKKECQKTVPAPAPAPAQKDIPPRRSSRQHKASRLIRSEEESDEANIVTSQIKIASKTVRKKKELSASKVVTKKKERSSSKAVTKKKKQTGAAVTLTPRQAGSIKFRNDKDPVDLDIVLSLKDNRYKEFMWKHYNILGEKLPGLSPKQDSQNIFMTLKRSLGKGGRFFKKEAHRDATYVVDDKTALDKITLDLKKRNNSIHNWLIVNKSKKRKQHPSNSSITQRYQFTKCGERAMEKYFLEVGKTVIEELQIDMRKRRRTARNRRNNGESNDLTNKHNILDEVFPGINNDNQSNCSVTRMNEHVELPDQKDLFLRNLRKNEARLLELRSRIDENDSNEILVMQLSSIPRKVLSETENRMKGGMLCMVLGCGKHAEVKCDGCCLEHFRLLSSVKGKDKKDLPHDSTCTAASAELPKKDDLIKNRTDFSTALGKGKVAEFGVQVSNPQLDPILSKLEIGSRIFVKWDVDGALYKATVKKIFFDREVPIVKIHYDGKKKHISDNISPDVIDSFIDGENLAIKPKQMGHGKQSLNKIQKVNEIEKEKEKECNANDELAAGDSANNFPPLQKLYPGVVPLWASETSQLCPELGPGWHVHISSRGGGAEDDICTDRCFISPTGKKFRSIPEVERYYWQNSVEFGAVENGERKQGGTDTKPCENVCMDKECNEIITANQGDQAAKADTCIRSTGIDQNFSKTGLPAASHPPNAKHFSGSGSMITISPITTDKSSRIHPGHSQPHAERTQTSGDGILRGQKMPELSPVLQSGASSLELSTSPSLFCLKPPAGQGLESKSCVQSPKEVAALVNEVINGDDMSKRKRNNSAYISLRRKVQPPSHYQMYQTMPDAPNTSRSCGKRSPNAIQSQRNDHSSGCVENEDTGRKRPKRTLKPITRFEDEDIPSSRSFVRKVVESKSVLCYCPDCDRGNLSVQGIYAHYGRAHNAKLDWQNVTYSCPFCPSNKTARIFKSLNEVEAHVSASHPGCEASGPHPSKLSSQTKSVQNISSKPGQDVRSKPPRDVSSKLRQDLTIKSDRVLRERKVAPQPNESPEKQVARAEAPQNVAQKQEPQPWTKIEFVQLLPDGRKDYSRELCRVIDMIDEQCQTQEEIVQIAHEQRLKLCRNESELESKALDDERLSYQRGIRERRRMADGERIEKQKFTEKAEQMMMRYHYENRNRTRNEEEIEVDKLCSRPIRFPHEALRHSTRQGKACRDNDCQFCKKDKGYLHHLLLDHEMRKFEMDAPPAQSPVFQQSTQVLNPSFRIISSDFLVQAEASDYTKGNGKEDSWGKRANLSRRDASTAKRLKTEEDKLFVLKNTKHRLEFIKKYNEGLILNAWDEARKDGRGRKLY